MLTPKVDAAALEIGNVAGTGEFVVDANGALTMTGANVGVTVVDGSAATIQRITSAGLADLTSLEVGNVRLLVVVTVSSQLQPTGI